jgi:hypothetical protein
MVGQSLPPRPSDRENGNLTMVASNLTEGKNANVYNVYLALAYHPRPNRDQPGRPRPCDQKDAAPLHAPAGKSMTRLSYWLWGIGSFVIIVAALAALDANHIDQALIAVVNIMWFVVLGMFAHARAVDAGRTPWMWVVTTLFVPVGFIVLGCFKTASCRREPIVATFDWSAA